MAILVAGVSSAVGQVSLNSVGTYTQNFNSLPNTGTGAWSNNTTLAGWYVQSPLLSPWSVITAQAGAGTTGSLASFGANSNSDRSLGWVYANSIGAAGTSASIGVGFTNNTGSAITAFDLSYTGVQWRTNAATPGSLTVQYKIGGSFDNSDSGWTSISALSFTGPNTTGSTSVDGYLAGNRVSLATASSIGLSLASSQTIWIRWRDFNDSGTDAQLAIDNVSFTAVPEPSSFAVLAGFAAIGFCAVRRRRHA